MDGPRKILYIDPNFKITYFLIFPETTFKSAISIPLALHLLKNEMFDLVLSEPDRLAIMVPQN